MKILFIAPAYVGGIGGHVARTAEKLREHGFDIKLMHAPHIPIKKLKNPSFALFSSLKAITDNENYDIVHAFNIPSAFAMKYTKAKKKILAVHGMYSEQIGLMHSNTAGKAANLAETKTLRWADKLTTDSRTVKNTYKEKFGIDFEFLYVPLDTTKFDALCDVAKKDQIIYVGRNSYEKGIDILKKIENRINKKTVYCTNLKWQDAMQELKASKLLVVPSRMESMPHVIKEAFFLKIPVIATKVGGVPELIQHEKNGILVDPEDPEQLLYAINDLLNNKEKSEKLAQAGHDFVINNLTWDILLPKYVKFYKSLAESAKESS